MPKAALRRAAKWDLDPVRFTDWDEATKTAAKISIGHHFMVDSFDTWEMWDPAYPDEIVPAVKLMANSMFTPTKGGHTTRFQLLVKYTDGRLEYVWPDRNLEFKLVHAYHQTREWQRPLGVPESPLAEDAGNGPRATYPPTGAEYLRQALKTFEERNKVYKDTHTMHGYVLKAMFPKGIFLLDAVDHSRYVTFNQIVGKLCRYATNFTDGGHQDSIHDVGVYAFILEAIDAYDQATKS